MNQAGEPGPGLIRLIAGFVCLHAAMTGGRMAAPLLALNQGHGKLAAGLLVGLFAMTQIFLSLPAGRFADRNGLRRPVGLSITMVFVAVGIAAIWPVYPVLCFTALVTGGAVGSATIAFQRHVGRMAKSPTQLKQMFSTLAIGPAASNFVGPVAAGIMIDLGGFRAAFLLLACLPLLTWIAVRNMRDMPSEQPRSSKKEAAWDLLRHWPMRRLLLMNWFMAASWDLHSFVVPVLGHERGLPASMIGFILGAFAISAVLVRLAMPVIAGRLREWALITGSIGATGLLFLIYPFTATAAGMAACSAMIGLALSAVQPMIMSTLHQITPAHRQGEALGIRLVMVNMSSVGMPLLFGAASTVIGAAGLFWVMGAILGTGSFLGVRLRSYRHDDG